MNNLYALTRSHLLQRHTIWALCALLGLLASFSAQAQSGNAFLDGNGNGISSATEPGIQGVVVKLYVNNGSAGDLLIGTTTTNFNGDYAFDGSKNTVTGRAANAGERTRIEFTIPANGCSIASTVDFNSLNAAQYGSNVQFITGTASGVNFGILNSDSYVTSTNPTLFVPCYVNGNVTPGTQSGNADVLISYLYTSAGVPASQAQGGDPIGPEPTHLASGANVGSVWGTAYSKQAKRVFIASFLKRHMGMGPGGSGAIYLIDPANPPAINSTSVPFTSLDALGFPTQAGGAYNATPIGFNGNVGSNTARGLPDGGATASNDASAFGQVGKVGLGGLDMSSDGRYLFTINLFDRKLYRLDLNNANSPTWPVAAGNVRSYDNTTWLTQTCDGGVARPFAVKYYRGKVYVGVVCTGENKTAPAGNSTGPNRYAEGVRAFIYSVDPTSGATTLVFEFPLNYAKETVGNGDSSPANGWFVWSDDYRQMFQPAYQSETSPGYPQPMLSDIEFDSDGSMILAFMDRQGHQWGIANNLPDNSSREGEWTVVIAGDILRTYKNPTTCSFELEANGVAGPFVSTSLPPVLNNGVFSGTGPGTPNGTGTSFTGFTGQGKEFYWGDYAFIFGNNYPTPHHNEGIMGGLAIWPSSGEVIATGLDPVDDVAWSGGTYRLDNATGARPAGSGYNLYSRADNVTQGQLGKANGLGDTEITGDIPPIEIGNRVWKDTDKDGVQDADEPGIDGITIQLKQGATVVGTTVTSNGGQWYFNSSNVTGGVLPNTAYTICIAQAQYDNQAGAGTLAGFALTTRGVTSAGDPNLSDSDADPAQARAQISYTTGEYGQSNFNLDFGLICNTPPTSPVVTPAAVTCNGTTPNTNGTLTISATGAQKVAYSTGTTFTGSYSAATAYTAGALVSNLANPATAAGQTYTVRFYGADESCFVDVTTTLPFTNCAVIPCTLTATAIRTDCVPATNQYTVNGIISLANNTAGGTATITDGSVTKMLVIAANATSVPYSLTGLISNGVSHSVIVSLAGCGTAVATYMAPSSCLPTTCTPPTYGNCVRVWNVANPGGTTCSPTASFYTFENGSFVLWNVVNATVTEYDNGTARIQGLFVNQANPNARFLADVGMAGRTTTPPQAPHDNDCGNPVNNTAWYYFTTACGVLTGQGDYAGGVINVQNDAANGGFPAFQFGTGANTNGLNFGASSWLTTLIVSQPTAGNFPFDNGSQSDFEFDLSDITPAISVVASTPVCNPATNQYTSTATISLTNIQAGTLTVTDNGITAGSVTVTANQPSATVSLTGISNASSHTITVTTSTGCGSAVATYSAPASCSIAPPSLTVIVSTPVCNSATNAYTATGTVSLTNVPTGATLTITDNGSVVSTTALTVGQTTANFSVSGVSNATSHTVVATLTNSVTVTSTTTYMAPVSCTVCSLSVTTSALANGQIGSAYSETIATTGGTAPLSYALLGTLPTGLSLNPTTGVISGTPTAPAGTASFTVTVTDAKSCSDIVALSITTSSQPVCSLTATATPGTCNTATNQYIVTGSVSATNAAINSASPQSLTISDGAASAVVTLTGDGPVSYTLTGLNSDGLTHTITVMSSATACGMTSLTYAAPVACTVCSTTLISNSLPRGKVGIAYSATLTATNGTAPYSFSVSGGTLPKGLSLDPATGVISGTPTASGSFATTITISDAKGCVVKIPLTVTQVDLADVCTVGVVATPGTCQSATNQYSIAGTVSLTSTIAGTLTITDGSKSTSIAVTASTTSVAYSLTGLSSGSGSHTVVASLAGCGTASFLYTAPVSCSVGSPTFAITKVVDQSRVEKGGIVTYTISLTNTSTVNATNLVVTDAVSSTALSYVSSGTASVGTFSYAGSLATNGTWTIPALAGGQVATLRLQALTTEEGVHYNTVTGPDGSTAQVCTSVPAHICAGTSFEYELSAPTTSGTYQWLKDGQPIAGATSATYSVTAVGKYSLSVINAAGCPDGSCCPFEVIADAAPSLTALAQSVSCAAGSPLANGAITLVGSNTAAISYNVSLGNTYITGLLPTNGSLAGKTTGAVLLGNLANPAGSQAYTIRVFSASGCYQDVVVTLQETVCECPAVKCAPYVIRKTKSGGKPVAP